jgi:hypothetical protein
MVHLYVRLSSTYFTCVVEESFDYFRPHSYIWKYDPIFDDGIFASLE